MYRPVEFAALPVELIHHILSFIKDADLINCTIITKKLRGIILRSSRLRYRIELAKHRMICLLTRSDKMPYASRLKILKDREHAWKTLSWKARHRLDLPPTGSVYEFAGGLYGNGKEDERGITASISFLKLPSSDPSHPSLKMWTHPMSDVTIVDFTMDPSQDLLVLISLAPLDVGYRYELHLRSLTTNQPHPQAPLYKLPCLVKSSNAHLVSERVAALRVQVFGDLVALLIKEVHDGFGAHLEIWDWINKPQVSVTSASGIADFTFVSKDAFLLVRPFGHFELYTFQSPISEETIPVCRVSYGFPPLSIDHRYWYITMSSNPTPDSILWPSDTNTMYGKGEQIYYPKPGERIHACCLYVLDLTTDQPEDRIHCFVFFVNTKSLLRPPTGWKQKTRRRHKQNNTRMNRYHYSSAEDTQSGGTQVQLPPRNCSSSQSGRYRPSAPSTATHPEYAYSYQFFPGDISTSSSHYPLVSPVANAPLLPFQLQSLCPSQGIYALSSLANEPVPVPAHIPWSVWGPQSTRWFPEGLSTDWQHSVYGLRTIEIVTLEKLSFPHTPISALPPVLSSTFVDWIAAEAADSVNDATWPSTTPVESTAVHSSSTIENSQSPTAASDSSVAMNAGGQSARRPRYLRLRDYNSYSVIERLREEEEQGKERNNKGKGRVNWNTPRVVLEPSTINTRGIFKHDITSWLPYVETMSEEKFDMTDVMMDDSRLLLLKRDDNGGLKEADVLTM